MWNIVRIGRLAPVPDNAVFIASRAGLSPASKRLITAGAFLVLLMAAAVGIAIWNIRCVALTDAAQTANELGIAIAEQTARSFQAIDLVLQATQKDISMAAPATPSAFRAELQTKGTFESLRQSANGLPQANAFTIIGADGQLINFSRRWPVAPISLSDRDYFIYFRDHDDKSPRLAGPFQNRGDGTWTAYVVRRIDSPSGQFLGLILGAVDLSYFDGFFKSVDSDDALNILLLRRDGTILSSYPMSHQTGRRLIPPNSHWYRIVAAGHTDTYIAQGLLIPGLRLISVHPLPDFPLVVNVSLSKSGVLANWRQEAMLAVLGTGCAGLCFLLLLRALVLQLQRLETARSSLAGQNAALLRVEAQITHLAHHDDLTKLFNRRKFRNLLESVIEEAGRARQGLSVLYLDLDRFKQVNDTNGHNIGDLLLIEVAARLRKAVRPVDTVARTGGDEFAIIQPMIADQGAAVTLAEILLREIGKPFDIQGVRCRIGISIGIASYPGQAVNASELLRNADTALYRAKADGRGLFCVFDETMDKRQQGVFALEQELKQALELNQFELDYQPIVEIATRRVLGCEALLRWRHPERGLIPPVEFIGMAEKLGLMNAIGHFVLETACAEAASWPPEVKISVNLSPVQFTDENLAGKLTEILQKTRLRPDRLSLEVTEGLLLEKTANVLGIMHRLRKLRVSFVLDDFGTGHAGLGYLRQFPFDSFKIDKFFVDDMASQPEARAIIGALVTISEALHLQLVAEGVETEAQLAILKDLGCKLVQGYLTGRPQPVAAIRRLLRETAAVLGSAVGS
jgi:diguanylate cyclase (GGDEF)-like protein